MNSQFIKDKDYFVNLILLRLVECEEDIKFQWNNPINTSTRHFFIDRLLPLDDVNQIYLAFPRNGEGFFDRNSFREKKSTSTDLACFDKILSDITYAIQDPRVVSKISDLCDMKNVQPDPKLYAGGLSMMFPGDYLNPHLDNSHDGERNSYRRLNLLYYVSPDWSLDYGGNLELWDSHRKIPKPIVALQNRLVVMETNRSSWHSVSKVLVDRPRCCVSNYYFSEDSPDGDDYFHVTSFLGRPNDTFRNLVGLVDNVVRNFISKSFNIGRGRNLINKDRLDK